LEGERARVEAERGAGKVAVIIPTYNEAENVVRVLRQVREVMAREGLEGLSQSSTTAALTGPLSW